MLKLTSIRLAIILAAIIISAFFVFGLFKYFAPAHDEQAFHETKVMVLSVDHSKGADGQYFNFSSDEMDGILGHDEWSGKVVLVKLSGTGEQRAVKLFDARNGGSIGDGHGRWHPIEDSAGGQWETGDSFFISKQNVE